MRNKLFLIAVMVPVVLGCGIMERVQRSVESNANTNSNTVIAATNSNKTLTEKAVDTAVGEQKIGIPECDEAMDLLEAQANNPDDNFVIKAGKRTVLNKFREQLKQQLEEKQTDKTEIAKFCREFRDNLADSAQESNSNSSR